MDDWLNSTAEAFLLTGKLCVVPFWAYVMLILVEMSNKILLALS